jgi:parallel beta-helix repeat protein
MTTTTVNSAAALTAALKVAHSGDTIQLQAGSYSGLNLSNLTFAQDVTITSADPTHQAVLNNFTLNHDAGITFSNVEMVAGGTAGYAFNVNSSNDIHFDHVYVHGSLDGNSANDVSGIAFTGTSNLSVTNSKLEQLNQGIGVNTASNVTISGNEVEHVHFTGLVFAQVDHVTVTGNLIHDVEPTAGVHPDAIQFFTTGTKTASHDIVVADNVIEKGAGDGTQGIFFRDQVGTLPFQNVHIDNNLVVGTGYGGIYVLGAQGLELSGNELISNLGKTNNTFFLIQNADNVTATNNQAQTISFDAVTHLTQSGDLVNQAVTDNGQAAMQAWAVSHPGSAGLLAPFLDVLPGPQVIPPIFPAPTPPMMFDGGFLV